ncbi:hypothetical protein BaRGS_00021220 [Batillaria attramentaria]|uniref:Uncharacterized protein n=1 Tax=Batillaria attramentaria TaxID=370345 RepID=A0ABD0KKH0_9CAEN
MACASLDSHLLAPLPKQNKILPHLQRNGLCVPGLPPPSPSPQTKQNLTAPPEEWLVRPWTLLFLLFALEQESPTGKRTLITLPVDGRRLKGCAMWQLFPNKHS